MSTFAFCYPSPVFDDYPFLAVIRCPECSYINRFRHTNSFTPGSIPSWKKSSCQNCRGRPFETYLGRALHYRHQLVCWACNVGIFLGSGAGFCSMCRRFCDGTEIEVWSTGEGSHYKQVDMEEEVKKWNWENKKLEKRERVCEVCGKVCKTQRGLKTHARSCEGEKEERFVIENLLKATRPALEV